MLRLVACCLLRVARRCRAQRRWELVALCPPVVWGPPLSARHAGAESVSQVLRLVRGEMWPFAPPLGSGECAGGDGRAAMRACGWAGGGWRGCVGLVWYCLWCMS